MSDYTISIPDSLYQKAQPVERGDKLTLRKSQAMKYLTQRAYSVTQDDLKPAEE